MKNFYTILTSLLFSTLLLTACGDKDNEKPANCNVVKEYVTDAGTRKLLNQYEYDATGKLVKYTSEETGSKTEGRFEYDASGRLIKLYDKLTIGNNGTPFDGAIEYLYNPNGLLYEMHVFRVEKGSQTRVYESSVYYNEGRIIQINTSYADHYRFEYNEQGNATKTFYKPSTRPEYLVEEYTSYNDKVQDTPTDVAFMARNIFFGLRGRNFSRNQVTAYKVYNEDGSLKADYAINREFNAEGKIQKKVTTVTSNGATTSTTLETEYPVCP